MYTSTQLVWTLPNVSYVQIIDTLTSNTDAISKVSVPPHVSGSPLCAAAAQSARIISDPLITPR